MGNWSKRREKIRHNGELEGKVVECWLMDFVSDALYDGRRLRVLAVVDKYIRECLKIEVSRTSLSEQHSALIDFFDTQEYPDKYLACDLVEPKERRGYP